jgi:hypothetical protein
MIVDLQLVSALVITATRRLNLGILQRMKLLSFLPRETKTQVIMEEVKIAILFFQQKIGPLHKKKPFSIANASSSTREN